MSLSQFLFIYFFLELDWQQWQAYPPWEVSLPEKHLAFKQVNVSSADTSTLMALEEVEVIN